MAVDKVTERKKEMKWARMLIKLEGKSRPSTVHILEGPRSYELQIWWEIPPWVTGVYTGVPRGAEKNQNEEDEVVARAAKRVGLPSLSCNDEGLKVQDCGTEKEWGLGLVGAVNVNYVTGSLMKNRGGAYVGEGGGPKGLVSAGWVKGFYSILGSLLGQLGLVDPIFLGQFLIGAKAKLVKGWAVD